VAGATPVDPDDTSVGSLSLEDCEAACASYWGAAGQCVAFTRPTNTPTTGDCFLRSAVDVDACASTGTYDTYTRVMPPSPPAPPNPPPAPCCDGYVNNFDTTDNAYGAPLPTTDVRNRSFAFGLPHRRL
jgi:hypothetical protein